MKLKTKIIINFICISAIKADILGNLVFFGRGQRHLANYWCDINKISISKGSRAYFPYLNTDTGTSKRDNIDEEIDENDTIHDSEEFFEKREVIADRAKNRPMHIFLPASKGDGEDYSEIKFDLDKSPGISLNLFSLFKSEMKLVPPMVSELKSLGYTCDSIGLPCYDLKEYNFEKRKEWLEKVDIRLFIEDTEGINNLIYKDEISEYQYEFSELNKLTTEWQECQSRIFMVSSTSTFTTFAYRNFGTMPVYIAIGNTIFLKKDPVYLLKNGALQNNFDSWSWSNDEPKTYPEWETVCPSDPEQKPATYLRTAVSGGTSLSIRITTKDFGPPEAISIRLRPMYDDKYNFNIGDRQTFNTPEILNERNCKMLINEESNILIDVRTMAHYNSKYFYNNDILIYWIQTNADIDEIKHVAGSDAFEEFYVYEFVLHSIYPTNLDDYMLPSLDSEKPCNLTMQSYGDWDELYLWPDDISFSVIHQSNNRIPLENEIEDGNVNNNSTNNINNSTNTDSDSSAITNNHINMILISFVLIVITILF